MSSFTARNAGRAARAQRSAIRIRLSVPADGEVVQPRVAAGRQPLELVRLDLGDGEPVEVRHDRHVQGARPRIQGQAPQRRHRVDWDHVHIRSADVQELERGVSDESEVAHTGQHLDGSHLTGRDLRGELVRVGVGGHDVHPAYGFDGWISRVESDQRPTL